MSNIQQIINQLQPFDEKIPELLSRLVERKAEVQNSLCKVQNVFVNKPSEGDKTVERNLAASLAQIIREIEIASGELEQLKGVVDNTIRSLCK